MMPGVTVSREFLRMVVKFLDGEPTAFSHDAGMLQQIRQIASALIDDRLRVVDTVSGGEPPSQPSQYHEVEIELDALSASSSTSGGVRLDGVQVKGCRAVSVNMAAKQLATVTFEIYAREVDVTISESRP